MKSIRLSLIVYFLVLLALALGGVSALAYQSAATTLHDKQAGTEDLIWAQFQTRCQDVRAALDRRLLRQAHYLASNARMVQVQREQFFLISAVALAARPDSRMLAPVWVAPATVPTSDFLPNYMAVRLQGAVRPVYELRIPAASGDPELALDPFEFFQTYRPARPERGASSVPAQRSASLRDHWFALSDEVRDQAGDYQEVFDDLELDGLKLRRVTLRARVTGTRVTFSPFSRFFAPSYKNRSTKQGAGRFPPPGTPPISFDQNAPVFFIQYASDTAHVNEQISQFEDQRDARLAESHDETLADLAHLRRRLFLIGCLTFAGIIVGGYLLLRLGLAPLSRLSDAVSRVSEKNFELQVDPNKLPEELRPIALRLSQSLQQLQKAFTHEKQAAADISHELRTPLAALMTTLDVALRKQRTLAEYRDALEECRSSGKHMSHLVERLMALARLDAGVERPSLELVDVAELAQQCADMVRPLAEAQGLTLHTELAESLWTQTDAGKLRDILINLLHNAVEYNQRDGRIELGARRDQRQVIIAVRDTGIGIAPEAQARLFERFFRADPSRHADTPHCGLGLAIVKSYVDLLGGSIRVDSSPAGSTFEIHLPWTDGEPATAVAQQSVMQATV
ncbi:MAG: HAMP domain-containing histidine kinase [Gemmataceae bacterium]|nr:HAMP domain-containing histidine kinase [Gemmataceae bacterium]